MRLPVFVAAALAFIAPALSPAEPNAYVRQAAYSAPLSLASPSVSSQSLAGTSLAGQSLSTRLAVLAPGADPRVIELAVKARECAMSTGEATGQGERLAVIDYSKPSSQKRLWVFDLRNQRLLYNEYVAHGQGSGDNFATSFSNNDGSHQTSLGLFRTAEVYEGHNGYSLRMDGLDRGFNDNARARAIVMHGAAYVDPSLVPKMGRIGRSHGCPAVRAQMAHEIIDSLRGGQFVFSYFPDSRWLHSSQMLACPTHSVSATVASR